MAEDKIVQFVSFETSLRTEQFITQWEQYSRSANTDLAVCLQQSEKNGVFKYIAQHRCPAGELKFVFTRAKKSSRSPEPEIRARQAGGYLLVQEQRIQEAQTGESKAFVFITDPRADLDSYRNFAHVKLNIYEAYYENCQYAFILEFYAKNKYLPVLLEQLKGCHPSEMGVYTECPLHALH